MQRYFIDKSSEIIEFESSSETYYHLTRVLRARVNDKVEFCDIDGQCFEYKITSITKENISFEKSSEKLCNNEVDRRVILALSLLKNQNFELVLQKAVELGVSDIVAFESSRTIVKSSNFNAKKIDRFNKIILEASEQSKRNVVPKFHNVLSFKELCSFECDNKFVAYEACSVNGDNLLINKLSNLTGDVMLVIGSEGGFSANEIEQLLDNKFEAVSLGKRILRAETAAISASAITLAMIEKGGVEV